MIITDIAISNQIPISSSTKPTKTTEPNSDQNPTTHTAHQHVSPQSQQPTSTNQPQKPNTHDHLPIAHNSFVSNPSMDTPNSKGKPCQFTTPAHDQADPSPKLLVDTSTQHTVTPTTQPNLSKNRNITLHAIVSNPTNSTNSLLPLQHNHSSSRANSCATTNSLSTTIHIQNSQPTPPLSYSINFT